MIKTTIKNLSAKPLSFQPVYLNTEGGEELEDPISLLKQGEVSMHGSVHLRHHQYTYFRLLNSASGRICTKP